ncbi:hypothetical protein AOT82_2 [Psychrobacter sp. AntiMn-1]|nr:hypothetical protein AOT82_2 [Psychrobacter sp. AntiMn-1]
MVTFIDDHKQKYGIEPICRVLPIAPSTYYRTKDLESYPEKRSLRQQHDDYLSTRLNASGRTVNAVTVFVKSGSR